MYVRTGTLPFFPLRQVVDNDYSPWRFRLHGNHEIVELINGKAAYIIIFFLSQFLRIGKFDSFRGYHIMQL